MVQTRLAKLILLYYLKFRKDIMDSLFELEGVEEIKECPRKSNKGIESIIIQIALQITQI